MSISYDEFLAATGWPPSNDDLERVNCKEKGSVGHWSCGWCEDCNLPQFQCGCSARQKARLDES